MLCEGDRGRSKNGSRSLLAQKLVTFSRLEAGKINVKQDTDFAHQLKKDEGGGVEAAKRDFITIAEQRPHPQGYSIRWEGNYCRYVQIVIT
ncbi:unnamed protein product [Linum trigynum]|uniref:Uncharacterized protein n=1 Tax=Linum trigynum TaxID=586398 RepID=A0AAV2CJ17_9ROSI